MDNQKAIQYNYRYSYLRAVSCVAIIILHTVYGALSLFAEQISPSVYMRSWMVVNNLRWAVPCFVMITGALLLDENRSITYGKIWKKYIKRVFLALLAFALIFRIFDMVMDGEAVSLSGFFYGFREFFTGTSWSHLWYLYLLIGLYLLLPFYRMIAEKSSDKDLIYLLVIYAVFLSVLPMISMSGVSSAFYIHVSTIYPFYFFLGYGIAHRGFGMTKIPATCLLAASTLLIIAVTYFQFSRDMSALSGFSDYSSILVIAQSYGIFCLFANGKNTGKESRNLLSGILKELDQCSFGIYLVHMIFARYILRYMSVFPYSRWFTLPVIIIVILALSYVTVKVLRLIPGIRSVL